MKNKNIAITVTDLSLVYRSFSKFSIKKHLFSLKKMIRKKYVALKNVSFDVYEGTIVGIIGKNGCGKTTLLKVLGNVFSPDSGIVDLHGHSVSLMAIGVGFNNNISGYENIFLSGMLLGFSEEEINEKIDEIIEFSELEEFIYDPVKNYSSGMVSKLAFSITAILETDIILIDEVLSVGDINFKQKSFNRMQELIHNSDKTVLIVSHDMKVLEDICDSVIWLHDGEVRMNGKPKTVISKYKEFMKVKN